MPRCTATTKAGKRCKAAAMEGTFQCLFHTEKRLANISDMVRKANRRSRRKK